jgi:hypothetical protein
MAIIARLFLINKVILPEKRGIFRVYDAGTGGRGDVEKEKADMDKVTRRRREPDGEIRGRGDRGKLYHNC